MRARIYKEDYKMAFTASDIKKGKTFLYDGNVYKCLDFQHVKPGKGAAFVRIKYRNIMTGATREDAFRPSEIDRFHSGGTLQTLFLHSEALSHRSRGDTSHRKERGSAPELPPQETPTPIFYSQIHSSGVHPAIFRPS